MRRQACAHIRPLAKLLLGDEYVTITVVGLVDVRRQSMCALSKDWRYRARVTLARSPCRHDCGTASPFRARCCHSSQSRTSATPTVGYLSMGPASQCTCMLRVTKTLYFSMGPKLWYSAAENVHALEGLACGCAWPSRACLGSQNSKSCQYIATLCRTMPGSCVLVDVIVAPVRR
jgi:hypothetical protein